MAEDGGNSAQHERHRRKRRRRSPNKIVSSLVLFIDGGIAGTRAVIRGLFLAITAPFLNRRPSHSACSLLLPMVRNVSNKFDLPDNPEYLDFPRTDGDSSRWPPHEQTVRVVNEDGHVDYMQYTPIEAGVCVRWRVVAGQAVARYLGLPGNVYGWW